MPMKMVTSVFAWVAFFIIFGTMQDCSRMIGDSLIEPVNIEEGDIVEYDNSGMAEIAIVTQKFTQDSFFVEFPVDTTKLGKCPNWERFCFFETNAEGLSSSMGKWCKIEKLKKLGIHHKIPK